MWYVQTTNKQIHTRSDPKNPAQGLFLIVLFDIFLDNKTSMGGLSGRLTGWLTGLPQVSLCTNKHTKIAKNMICKRLTYKQLVVQVRCAADCNYSGHLARLVSCTA